MVYAENSVPLTVLMTVSVGSDLERLRVDDIKFDSKTGETFYAD